jgi:hypothetical protein
LEVTADVSTPTFGENGIRVSGFVVGQSYSAAQAFYVANVRNLYASKLILDESLSEAQDFIQGSALTPLASDGSTSNLFGRLSFSLTIWAPKTTGSFAVQYEMAVELDYTKLTQSTKLQGTLFASQVDIGKAENRTTGNVLDVFIATLHLGLPLNDSRTQAHDYLATNNDNQMALKFAQSFISVITNPTTLILQTEIQEEINYTGTRWSEFKTPDGVSVIQKTGIECGSRSVSGTVVAATETAGRTYVKNMIWSGSTAFMQAFPAGSTAPTTRYIRPPKISTKFVFIPLTQGVARGTGQNIQVVELAFSFSEILPAYSFNL